MNPQSTDLDPAELRRAWTELRRSDNPPRQRDAAAKLGASEAQLVAASCGETATRLEPRWIELFHRLESLGTVMALTRNEHIVIEKDGVYRNVEISHGTMGSVVDEGIDLRVFFSHWSSGFAVVEQGRHGVQRSFQFFDPCGIAVHKTFLREHSSVESFDALVAEFRSSDQSGRLAIEPRPAPPERAADADVDVAGMRARWEGLKDTHDFFFLLRDFKVSRLQALRLAGAPLAHQVRPDSAHTLLDQLTGSGLSVMVFVGNPGCIEIHTGPIERVKSIHGWLNVLDPGFNLHIDESGLSGAWVVHKPGDGTIVSSLELFAPDGENIAMLFANRKAGEATVDRWKQLLAGLSPS